MVELITRGQILAVVKIQRGIFLEESFSLLKFVIEIMLLSYKLKKFTGS